MVVEDEDGRALKFRTRTKVEYARIRPGMVVEAVLVSERGSAARDSLALTAYLFCYGSFIVFLRKGRFFSKKFYNRVLWKLTVWILISF